MAGTGKTTLIQRLNHFTSESCATAGSDGGATAGLRAYYVNMDPAVADVPFAASIDIRDTVDYKGVMTQYRLGPNGSIMTALNLFATKIHQVIDIIERRREELDVVFVDTPGQIEVFTWSASGQLITEAFAACFPTCIIFVADACRCANPQTFMSTMLYASSIMYKLQLPLLIAVNKTDVVKPTELFNWMRDPDSLSDAVRQQKGFAASLTESLSLFVHEFYQGIRTVAVSAITGEGIPDLFAALEAAQEQYATEFLPLLKARVAANEKREAAKQSKMIARLENDMAAAAV
mgnify:FL=1